MEDLRLLKEFIGNGDIKEWSIDDLNNVFDNDDCREKLMKCDVMDIIMNNCNEEVHDELLPIYTRLVLNDKLLYVDNLFKEVHENKDLAEEILESLKNTLISWLRSEGAIDILVAGLVLSSELYDGFVDLREYRDNLKEACLHIEKIMISLENKLNSGIIINFIIELMLDLYNPFITNYVSLYNENLITEEDATPGFREFLKKVDDAQKTLTDELRKQQDQESEAV